MRAVQDEVEACVRGEYHRLVQVVALVTGSVSLAEESVQEAFARAWERAARGEQFTHLAGWVVTVALNHARRGRTRRRAERRAGERIAARPPAVAADPAVGPAVRAAVDGLPGRQRQAVVLYYLLDLDVATTAAVLGVSEGTVKTALSRARHKLAALLDDQEVETQ